MHMSDALISPAVGAAFWAVAGGWLAHCARRLRNALRESLAPRMGVLGAFVFAAQMINFAIPGTGSSGHLGGGLLLAILLGPHAAFLAIASVLACCLFAAVSGSSPATVVAVGSIVIAGMVIDINNRKFIENIRIFFIQLSQ